MSLYTDLRDAGVDISNHESDLYFPNTPQTRAILAKHPLQHSNSTTFKSAINGSSMVDVPFAFEPFWERKMK